MPRLQRPHNKAPLGYAACYRRDARTDKISLKTRKTPDLCIRIKLVILEVFDVDQAQVINYLAITGYKLGMLVNFNAEKVKPERIVRY